MKSFAILELLAEAKPGFCPLCDELIPAPAKTGRPRKYCGARDCYRLYWNLYRTDSGHSRLRALP